MNYVIFLKNHKKFINTLKTNKICFVFDVIFSKIYLITLVYILDGVLK
jgi:hypothetical protein